MANKVYLKRGKIHIDSAKNMNKSQIKNFLRNYCETIPLCVQTKALLINWHIAQKKKFIEELQEELNNLQLYKAIKEYLDLESDEIIVESRKILTCKKKSK